MVTEKLPFEFGLFSALTVQSWEQILASGSFQSKVNWIVNSIKKHVNNIFL
jgi:hypothetical protein